ncbi:hypothetical protein D9M69_153100 [compost metagenome]
MSAIEMPVSLATLAVLGLCLAGMSCLGLAMDRHHDNAWPRPPAPAVRRLLRLAGWLLLALACWPCLRGWGASIGAVVWVAALTAVSLPLTLVLTYRPRLAPWLAPPAVGIALACLTILS